MSTPVAGDRSDRCAPTYPHLFTGRCSPHAAATEEHTRGWLDAFALTGGDGAERLKASRFGRVIAHVYPAAPQVLLELAADLFAWLVAFDDVHVEATGVSSAGVAPRIAAFVRVLATGTAPAEDPFARALADLAGRTRELMAPAQAERVHAGLHEAFLAMLWDTTTHRRAVGLAEYRAMRPHTFFGQFATTLVEPCAGLDLPAAVHADPRVRRLLRGLATLWAWTNDLDSYRYEQQALGTEPQTLPGILARENGLTEQEAFALARRMCDEEAAEVHRLITELSDSPTPGLPDFARAVGDAVGGTQDLRRISDRWRTA
ncbi:terpene synthase [Kitasatospora sp. NPDC089509]|uniref:terpene synthase family protein n=1 Tax=Kitasatospora sp. NPDC089509 TaxID=3364079 RepID=UPI0038031172